MVSTTAALVEEQLLSLCIYRMYQHLPTAVQRGRWVLHAPTTYHLPSPPGPSTRYSTSVGSLTAVLLSGGLAGAVIYCHVPGSDTQLDRSSYVAVRYT